MPAPAMMETEAEGLPRVRAAAGESPRRQKERDFARAIDQREIDLWEELLAWERATGPLLDLVEEQAGGAIEFSELRCAAEAPPRGAARAKLRGRARKAAVRLRASQRDRRCLDAALGAAERLARGADGARYLGRVRARERRLIAARNVFVEANIGLVRRLATSYCGRGVPLADLVQEGTLGLIEAAQRFDPERGPRFSTYAVWWIRYFIGRAVSDGARLVRLPIHLQYARQRMLRASRGLALELGRAPTEDELVEATGLPRQRLESAQHRGFVEEISLDEPYGADEGRPRVESFLDPHADEPSLVDELTTRSLTREVSKAIENLPPREAEVLRRRYGMQEDHEWSLQEIAKEYRVSRERIRQLQSQALGRIGRTLRRRRLLAHSTARSKATS